MIATLRLLQSECRREWRHTQTYFLEFLSDQVLFTVGFFLLSGIFQILAEGDYTSSQMAVSLLGYLTWRIADGCILRTVNSVETESRWGTLEQIWLAPTSPLLILIVRSIVILFAYLLRVIMIGIVLVLVLRLPLDMITLSALFLVLGAQISVLGATYMLVGLQLTHLRVSSLTLAFSTVLLFVTGALVPLDHAPWLAGLAQLLPLGPGISLLQDLLQTSNNLAQVLMTGRGAWFLGHSLFYLTIGLTVLRFGADRARTLGQLAQY